MNFLLMEDLRNQNLTPGDKPVNSLLTTTCVKQIIKAWTRKRNRQETQNSEPPNQMEEQALWQGS